MPKVGIRRKRRFDEACINQRTSQKTELAEVVIFRNNDERVLLCIVPNRRIAVSCGWSDRESTFAGRRKREASADILATETGKISEDLLLAHSSSQIFQNIVNSDSRPHNTGFSNADTRHDSNFIVELHFPIVPHG